MELYRGLQMALCAASAAVLAGSMLVGCDASLPLKTEETTWPDGQRQRTTSFYVDEDGNRVLHGTQTEWFENGQKRLEVEYRHGKQYGLLTEWYSDGTKAREGRFDSGREEGPWVAWQPAGEKLWEATYRGGKIVGKKRYWTGDDVVREETYGPDGQIETLTIWHEGGAKAVQGTFRSGRKHGTWTYWHPDGTVKAEGEWRNGNPWAGLCGIPVPGDAGSLGGIETFAEYRDGRPVANP